MGISREEKDPSRLAAIVDDATTGKERLWLVLSHVKKPT